MARGTPPITEPDTDRGVTLVLLEPPDGSLRMRHRLVEAASARARIKHPNVLRALTVDGTNGRVQVGLERRSAPSLSERLRSGSLDPLECVLLIDGLADGCESLARAGLLARDFTPKDVLFDPEQGGILGDTGIPPDLVKPLPLDAHADLAYRAPEELQNHALDSRSSVYSLGALLYTALTGAPPFSGTWSSIYQAQLTAPRPQPTQRRPELPREIDAVLAKAMAVDPRSRYANPAELAYATACALSPSPDWDEVDQNGPGRPDPAGGLPQRFWPAPGKPQGRVAGVLHAAGARVRGVTRAPARGAAHDARRGFISRGGWVALVLLAVAGCAVLGMQLAQATEEKPPPPPTLASAGDLGIELPSGWRRTQAPGAGPLALPWALTARPSDGMPAGLAAGVVGSKNVLEQEFAEAGGDDASRRAVRLGSLDAWRYDGLRPSGAAAATAYLAPVSAGTLVVLCYTQAPNTAAGRARLRECNGASGTVSLAGAEALALSEVSGVDARLQRTIATLGARRTRALRRLRSAKLARGQATAAGALEWSYDRAAAGLGVSTPLEPGGSFEDVTDAMREASAAWGLVATAARRSGRSGYRQAAQAVEEREQAVRRAVAAAQNG